MSSFGRLDLDLRRALRGRVVIMGIGNPMGGDDAVGSCIARLLHARLQATSPPAPSPVASPSGTPTVTVLDAEDIPESWLGPAVAARPDAVLLVDAAELGEAPGTAALFSAAELGRHALFTHRTPLGPLADFLARETGAEVQLLGIQPGPRAWGEELSPALAGAAADLVTLLTAALGAAALHSPGPEALAC